MKNFGIKSNVKMVHINLISILFSMNKLSFMKTLFKTEGWDEERGDFLLSFVKETLDDARKLIQKKYFLKLKLKIMLWHLNLTSRLVRMGL